MNLDVDVRETGAHSLYDGWKLKGWPVRTIVRGLTVMENHEVVGPPGHGKYLRRRLGAAPQTESER